MSTPPETQTESPLRLQLSADGRRLQAVIEPPRPDAPMLDSAAVTELLEQSGCSTWFVRKDEIARIPKLARTVKHTTLVDVAEKRDAEMAVTISRDELVAHLSIAPAQGGDPVTEADVLALLERNKIRHGVLHEVIAQAVAAQHAEQSEVARGTPPVDGRDTGFETLLPEISDRRPRVNDDGSVDYREISAFFTVTPGTPLLRRVPRTDGEAGTTVAGTIIPPKPGRDLQFAAPLSGARADADDPNVLVASVGGQPIVIERGVTVEPVINLATVDLTTGNINFDGTVNVAGDVAAGLCIRSRGDVFISGTVEGAIIESGGNIKVNKGIIGRGDVRQSDGSVGTGVARISAKGSVQARFIENALVEAEGDVIADELMAHCEIKSSGAVIVGRTNAKKGHILSGSIVAVHGIKAQVIGSGSGARTRLEAGQSRMLRAQLDELRDAIIAKSAERDKLATLVERADRLPGDVGERARKSLAVVETELKSLHERRDALTQQLNQDSYARIDVGMTLHEGALILLGERKLTVDREHGPGRFALADGEIVYTPR
jgi:hypothetical protein